MSIDDYYLDNELQADCIRRARKDHQCCACGETVRRGERYRRTAIKCEGDLSVYVHCLRCAAICEALWKAGAGVIDMNLDCGHEWEENDSELGPLPPEVARLAFLSAEEVQALDPEDYARKARP